ncbi:hypothetical protein P8C59_008014 [Phyllachora maydis]|uniref:BHLH domain-containing protein n=1 Tax=Phyllachora maydis TaxID=1825666 RepID=A0AAD9IAM0_9PEZI|nr:hypothetical protein P8C59_008014 [Phyllachora maydis]
MSSPNKSSSPNGPNIDGRATAAAPGGGDEKPRLTEEEKKQNHIASEQKRRQAIREGFDRLTELVPGLEGQGRSEGLVLNRTVEFMREKLEERRQMIERLELAGHPVDDALKRPLLHMQAQMAQHSYQAEMAGKGKGRAGEGR